MNEQIAQYIKERIEDGGWKQNHVSKKTGINPVMLSCLLSGKREWKLAHLQAMADFFQMPIADLVREATRQITSGGR